MPWDDDSYYAEQEYWRQQEELQRQQEEEARAREAEDREAAAYAEAEEARRYTQPSNYTNVQRQRGESALARIRSFFKTGDDD